MMPRDFNGRRCVQVVILLGLVRMCLLETAATDGQEDTPAVLRFQRITIPEGRIDDIGGELLPVEREAFRKTVTDLNSRYHALYGVTKPSIVRARYVATFDNRQLVGGSAELDIKHPHAEPAYLPLSPFGLAADSFRWASNPGIEAEADRRSRHIRGAVRYSDVSMVAARIRRQGAGASISLVASASDCE